MEIYPEFSPLLRDSLQVLTVAPSLLLPFEAYSVSIPLIGSSRILPRPLLVFLNTTYSFVSSPFINSRLNYLDCNLFDWYVPSLCFQALEIQA